jgi:hypothetical protein
MTIALKQNNRPKEPGYYIMHRPDCIHAKPELTRVDSDSYIVFGISLIPLSRLEKSALWSDRLDIVVPGVEARS